ARPVLEVSGVARVRPAPLTPSASTAHPCRRAVSAMPGSDMSNAISLNGRLVARWARRAVDRLRRERTEIDEPNVFPVPDGDTGTNMYHTLRSAYLAVEQLTGPVTLPQVVRALADG